MKKQLQWFISALALFLSVGIALKAPDQAGQAAPDSTQPTAAQSFTGTVVKQGDKYVFQDAATGNTYDIDHQDEVQKFEGKKVKVRGTLDASGKMIHIQ